MFCRALAVFPPAVALGVWRSISAILTVASAVLIWATVRNGARDNDNWKLALIVLYACTMFAVPLVMEWGQSSIFVLFALSLLIFGEAAGSRPATIAGLVLCCMKPQFGGPICLAMLVDPRRWLTVAIAAGVSAVLAAPQLIAFGLGDSIHGFLDNMAKHAGLAPNGPGNLTGLANILNHIGVDLPPLAYVALLAAILCPLFLPRLQAMASPRDRMTLVCALSCFVLPLHIYDVAAIVPALMIGLFWDRWARIAMAICALLLFRPFWITDRLGKPTILPSGNSVAEVVFISVLLLVVAGVCCVEVLGARRRPAEV